MLPAADKLPCPQNPSSLCHLDFLTVLTHLSLIPTTDGPPLAIEHVNPHASIFGLGLYSVRPEETSLHTSTTFLLCGWTWALLLWIRKAFILLNTHSQVLPDTHWLVLYIFQFPSYYTYPQQNSRPCTMLQLCFEMLLFMCRTSSQRREIGPLPFPVSCIMGRTEGLRINRNTQCVLGAGTPSTLYWLTHLILTTALWSG